jgi:hypothetical protein
MHPYVVEQFTDAETAVLRRYFTNLEGPVFALVNLPEVVEESAPTLSRRVRR